LQAEIPVPLCDKCEHSIFLHFDGRCHNIVVTEPWVKYPKHEYHEHEVPPCMCVKDFPDNYDTFAEYFKKIYPKLAKERAHSSYAHYKGHIKQVEKMQRDLV